jgi:hypothetical protein
MPQSGDLVAELQYLLQVMEQMGLIVITSQSVGKVIIRPTVAGWPTVRKPSYHKLLSQCGSDTMEDAYINGIALAIRSSWRKSSVAGHIRRPRLGRGPFEGGEPGWSGRREFRIVAISRLRTLNRGRKRGEK